MNKNQGTICVCMEFRDLNKSCPKDNFPMPFIDYILDECAGREIFSFMDGFSGYNQIQIRTNTRRNLYVIGILFPTRKFLSA